VQPFVYSKYKYAISYYLSGWHSRVRSELKVQPFYVDTRDIDICYLFLYFFVFVAFPIFCFAQHGFVEVRNLYIRNLYFCLICYNLNALNEAFTVNFRGFVF